MRVLHIAPVPFYFETGKSLRVYNNLLGVRDAGYEVDVLTYPYGEDIPLPGTNIIRARWNPTEAYTYWPGFSRIKLLLTFGLLAEAISLVARQQYAFVHAHDVDGAAIALVLKVLFGVPYLYDMHGAFSELVVNIHGCESGALLWFLRAFERILYRNATTILLNWQHLRAHVSQFTDIENLHLVQDLPPREFLQMVANDQDLSLWGQGLRQRAGTDLVVAYVGTFASYQRIDLVLRGFELAYKRSKRPLRLILGGVPDKHSLKLAERLGLGDRAIFTGQLNLSQVVDVLRIADIGVSMRTTQGFPPMKIIHYFHAGLAIVASNWPCHKELMIDQENGLLCQATPEDFSDKLVYLANNPDELSRLKARSSLSAQRFSVESVQKALKTAYSETLSRTGAKCKASEEG